MSSKEKGARSDKDCQRNLDHELAASRIAFFFAKISEERDVRGIVPTLEAVEYPIDKAYYDDGLSVASTISRR